MKLFKRKIKLGKTKCPEIDSSYYWMTLPQDVEYYKGDYRTWKFINPDVGSFSTWSGNFFYSRMKFFTMKKICK